MKRRTNRLLSLLLALCMVLSLLPGTAWAENDPAKSADDELAITISAKADNTITVKEPEPTPSPSPDPGPVVYGSLSLTSLNQTIKRDYEQECMITVRNNSDEAKEFYLDIVNNYKDLSMEIIKTGSKNSPAIIAAGESISVELSVFAQNAENEEYTIPVTAYVLADGEYVEDSKNNIRLTCDLPILNLSWSMVSSSESTLSQTWRITNNGETLTDLSVLADENLKDYIMFSPIVSNYELERGKSLEFEVRPDLAKIKNESISILDGSLVALCAGKTSENTVTFDTEGKKITVTTLGELALQQDGNPFTKFEISDRYSLKYKNEYGTFVEVTGSTTLNDIVDENNYLEYEYDSSVYLGNEMNLDIKTAVKSYAFTGNPADYEKGPLITMTAGEKPGTIQVVMRNIMDYDSYLQLINSRDTEQVALASFAGYVAVESVTNWSIDQVKDFALEQLTGVDWAGKVYDAGKYLIEAEADSIKVDYDPRMSQQAKSNYNWATVMKGILTFGTIAVDLTCPAVGFVFSIMTAPLGVLIDEYQKALIAEEHEKYGEIYSKLLGSQCTNRGSIGAKFYVPDYGKGKKPTLHTSGRMYGGGYVNREDTNYDILLNGEKVGVTENAGLTDVHMEEIPTDSLLPGRENEIVFDYDTSPGSHYVTADTEITLLYPDDTEIAYIGEPDDLQDVRTKPDFCVYDENIFTSDDPIVGEPSKLSFNVYNRGSRGGWFNIVCYADNKEIYRETNYYLGAFSAKTFEIKDWIPSSEHTTVRVELTNTSIGLDERSTSNNSASRTVSARRREVPQVRSLNSGTIYENMPFSLMVDVENSKDVTAASFTLDGTISPATVRSSDQGSYQRYWLTFDQGVEKGQHALNAEVSYKTSNGGSVVRESLAFTVSEEVWIVPSAYTMSSSDIYLSGSNYDFYVYDTKNLIRTEISVAGKESFVLEPVSTWTNENSYSLDLSKYAPGEAYVKAAVEISMYYLDRSGSETVTTDFSEITIVSEKDSYYSFTLGSTSEEPEISVYRYSSMVSCDFEKTGSGGYRCLKTLDMYNDPAIYTVIISYSTGIIVTDMSQSGQTITEDGCYKLTIEKSEKDSVSNATVDRISGIGTSSYYVSLEFDADKPLHATPGVYSVSISGEVDNVSFNKTLDVDLSNSDQSIDLSSFVLIYYFDIISPKEDDYDTSLYYRNSGSSSWYNGWLNSDFDKETGVLKCYSASSWTAEAVHDCEEAMILVTSPAELFVAKVKELSVDSLELMSVAEENRITLDRASLNEVTLKNENDEWEIGEVDLEWDQFAATLYGSTIFIPDGDYSFSVELISDDTTVFSNTDATVNDNCEVTVGSDLSKFLDVIISWAEPFDQTGRVQYTTNEGKNITSSNFSTGNTIKAEEGERVFHIGLSYADDDFEISRAFNVSEENKQLTIGSHFVGSISNYFYGEYDGGESVTIGLSNAKDDDGNILSSVYAYSLPLKGQATFVDVDDSTRTFTTPLTATNLDRIELILPEESGTFSISVDLTTAIIYTVTFDSMGGSFVASRSVFYGNPVSKPSDPVRDNYTFQGWYTDTGYTQAYDFNSIVTGDITLYAKWKSNSIISGPSGTSSTTSSASVKTNSATNGSFTVSNKNAKAGDTVKVTPKANDGYKVGEVVVKDSKGNTVTVTNNGDGTYSFVMPKDTPVTVDVTFVEDSAGPNEPDDPTPGIQFTDVPADAYYYDAVQWAVKNGITHGTDATHFSPANGCTRAQFVTFLWRAADSPEPVSTENPFTDVSETKHADYYKAILWAAEQGITVGTGNGKFSPDVIVTRAQSVTFMYRYAQKAGIANKTGSANFDDVNNEGALTAYYEAIGWAVANGITYGTGDGKFSPMEDCNRGMMITFLHRLFTDVSA